MDGEVHSLFHCKDINNIRVFIRSVTKLFQLQTDTIRYHRDKLGVCRFSFAIVDRIAKDFIHSFRPPPVPSNLNGMPDGTLHS